MGKRDDIIEMYKEENKKLNLGLSDDLIVKVTMGLGPAIYNNDSNRVSSTDPEEVETVKNNYLIKKLGMTENDGMIDDIKETLNKLGSSNPNKYRALVYALLCDKYGKESIYS